MGLCSKTNMGSSCIQQQHAPIRPMTPAAIRVFSTKQRGQWCYSKLVWVNDSDIFFSSSLLLIRKGWITYQHSQAACYLTQSCPEVFEQRHNFVILELKLSTFHGILIASCLNPLWQCTDAVLPKLCPCSNTSGPDRLTLEGRVLCSGDLSCCLLTLKLIPSLDTGRRVLDIHWQISFLEKLIQTSRNAARSLRICPCISDRLLQPRTRGRGSSVDRARQRLQRKWWASLGWDIPLNWVESIILNHEESCKINISSSESCGFGWSGTNCCGAGISP